MNPVNNNIKNLAIACSAAKLSIAIVGSGPRGLAVLERLAVHLSDRGGRDVSIWLIDAENVGAGRIWRPDQSQQFIMNTVAGEVTAFSGPSDGGPSRAGAGPSFSEWRLAHEPDSDPSDGYPPRALYGRYMHYVLNAIEQSLAACGTRLHRMHADVVDMERRGGQRVLLLGNGKQLTADRVLLATGHARPAPADSFSSLSATGPQYMPGDSAPDMPLHTLQPGEAVGLIGLGLGFYDIMAELTLGRGGRFVETGNGELQYVPSNREPLLYAGSRSGLPVQSRGRNQKPSDFRYVPAIFTPARLASVHRPGHTDFRDLVLPLLEAEVNLVYYATELQRRSGESQAQLFRDQVAQCPPSSVDELSVLARSFGLGDLKPLSLQQVANPFAGVRFDGPRELQEATCRHLRRDISEAEAGNVDSPFKAAMDIMRDVRGLIRPLVDFGGLSPQSHRHDLVEWYSPLSSLLAAGPPIFRARQLLALIEAGIVRIVGPDTSVGVDEGTAHWYLHSPQVAHSRVMVRTLVDTRIPKPDILQDPSPLTRSLLKKGFWRPFTNRNDEAAYQSGGVDITQSPFHPIQHDGEADPNVHVLGIPAEHTRWFTQVGSSRPGQQTDFFMDADAIAQCMLAPVGERMVSANVSYLLPA